MKAIIKNVEFKKETESKFGTLFNFLVTFEAEGAEKRAYYSCKIKQQTKFIPGKEAEFNLEEKEGKNGTYYTIKPLVNKGNFGTAIKREQSKYSGFSLSYAKDLVVAGKIDIKDLLATSEKLFNHMVELDKRLQND